MQVSSKPVFLLIAVTALLVINSCEKDDPAPEIKGYAKGVFIRCEGSFQANNGSVSWYDTDSARIVNNLFSSVNGRPAGDVVQSFALAGDYGVIVANNSQKIEVVDLETFESTATITGFTYPRYFQYSGNGTGYLSNGSFGGQVYKIDLHQGVVTDTIEVGMGPEQMVISGNHLFVANSGGWGYDNTVSVVDIQNNQVVNTIEAGDIPVALVSDRHDNIWVLCRGKEVYNDTWTEVIDETDSKLVRINSAAMTVDKEIIIGQQGDGFSPSWLTINPGGDILYYGEADGLYQMSINGSQQPEEPFISELFSAAGIHPQSGELFALKQGDYVSPGELYIYDTENNLVSAYDTGLAPGGIVFAD